MLHHRYILLWILLLSLVACVPVAPTATPAPPPRGGREAVPGGVPPARQTALAATARPGAPLPRATARPSPTALAGTIGPTATSAPIDGAPFGFHINFLMDEAIACPGEAPCDAPYLPNLILYFRANVDVAADRTLHGEGTIQWTDVSACRTLMPDVSSCQVNGATSGSFSVTGKADGDLVQMTLHLDQAPGLSVTMVTQSPSGQVSIPLDATYAEEIARLLEEARIFGTPIAGKAKVPASASTADFEGSCTLGDMRTLHGYGGLFFVSPDMPMPEEWQPEA